MNLRTRCGLINLAVLLLTSTGISFSQTVPPFVTSSGVGVFMPGTINTIAGNGTEGFAGDGGAATSAELGNPTSVAVDASGNIYIADFDNSVIRKVTPAGTISTIAGTGTQGFSGDGGPATSAELQFPQGVAVDAAGNVYIADTFNSVIRKVTPSGTISTVAGTSPSSPCLVSVNCFTGGFSGDGGAATSAELNNPQGVAVDAAGNLYISDTDNSRIRKVTAAGIISTIAGNGSFGFSGDGGPATSAAFGGPEGIAVDASGNVYIADEQNSVIRKVTAAGIISTFAGTGQSTGFSGDGGPASSALLFLPLGVAVDASGNVYIADTSNQRIRVVAASTGIITTYAGDGIFNFSGDGGPASSAEFNSPEDVAIDAAGDIYILDEANERIREISFNGFVSFGAQTLGPTTTVDAAFTNIGNANLTISSIVTDGNGVFTLESGTSCAASLVLAPGASCTVAVGFTPAGATSSITGSLTFEDNGQTTTQTATLSGAALQANPGMSASCSPTSVLFGGTYTCTATVLGGFNPTGTMTWPAVFGGQTLSLSGGSTTTSLLTATAPPNVYSGTVTYSGDANNAASFVTPTLIVTQDMPTISISNIPSVALFGGNFTAAYSYNGNGTPSVSSSTPSVCTASGSMVTFAAAGTCTLTAMATSTTDDTAVVGSAQSFTVQIATTIAMSSSANPSQFDQSVGFTVLVNTGGTVPAGSVSFMNGGTTLGTETVTPVSTTNLTPDSNFEDGLWQFEGNSITSGNMPIAVGAGPGGAGAFVYTGTGSPAGFNFNNTPVISVTPGVPYTLSGYINATSVTSGTPEWAVFSPDVQTEYASVVQNPGAEGRLSSTFVFPSGVTQVIVIADTSNATVSSGGQVIWSKPQLEQASQEGPYIQTGTVATFGSGGIATFTTSSLPVGTDSITSVFSGSPNSATSLALPQVVTAVTPTVTVSCSPNPATFASSGLVATCTAAVSGGATGTVTFSGTDVVAPNQTLSSGVATLGGFFGIPPGTYTVTATYNGDANNNPASGSATLTINPVSQTITFAPLANQTFGVKPFTVSASASSGLPVSFASTTTGVCTVSGATVSVVAVGTCTIQATQAGNADFTPATAMSQSFTVSQAATFSEVFASSSSIAFGQTITLSSLVDTGGTAPTGTLSLEQNGTVIGSGTVSTATTTNVLTFSNQFSQGNWILDGGQGDSAPTLTPDNQTDPFGGSSASTLVIPAIPAGENSWIENDTGITPTGVYTMSVWLKANTNSTVTLQMTESNSNDAIQTEVNVTTSWQRFNLTSGAFDGTAELLWRVLGVSPSSGTTVFIYGAQLEQAGSVGPYVQTETSATTGSGGSVSGTTASLAVGTDSITAVYSGDPNNQGSTSLAVPVVVTAATPSISASCSPNPVVFGNPFSCTATVSGGDNPTGTVTFPPFVGSQSATLSGGSASVSGTASAVPQTFSGTVTYNGNANNNSVSSSVSLTSVQASQTITFTAPTSPVTVGVAPIALSATASSGLPVAFSVISGPGSISGSSLGIDGPGTIVVAANQAGNAEFSAAAQVTQTVVVNDVQPATPPSSVAVGVVTPYLISLIAGNGTAGSGPFGGAATSAETNGPRDAAVDSQGNIYIADLTNNVVEKVNTSGVISIFAGTGTAGFSGDGGPATSADLNSPQGIAFDSSGNVYIADRNNNVVRKVSTSGVITTFAGTGTGGFSGDGGPATSAELASPVDVAFDPSGNLYIADRTNVRVRTVSALTGVITTIAGNGTVGFAGDGGPATSAEFGNLMQDITVDGHGNVFIADAANNRIRMIAAGTGTISTVAGNGTAGFSGDGGQATSAELSSPFGVAVDAAGNLYLSDETNSRLRMVSTSGTITTIAGGGSAGLSGIGVPAQDSELSGPSGISLAPNGTIYFADLGNNTVRSLGPNGALPFASQPVASTSAAQAVTVQNIGAATLTFSAAPSVTGDFAIASGNTCGTSGSTLAAGASCSIAVTFSPTDVGARTGTLTLADNGVATSQQVVLTGKATEDTTTTVRLTSSISSSTFGQAVVFSATVPSGATGTVQFLNGTTSLGTSTISSGVATLLTTALPVGTDSITAVYLGDANFAGATSAALSQMVGTSAVNITSISALSISTYGQIVTFTFTVTGVNGTTVVPTGSLQVMLAGTPLANVSLVNGIGTFVSGALPGGKDNVTAIYSGDSKFH
jgi:sugar lactone lactonase YvrE